MKMLIAVINKRDSRHLNDALIDNGFRFTEIGSTGGFLRAGNVTLLIGVVEDQVEAVLSLIRKHCQAREETVNLSQAATRIDEQSFGEAIQVLIGGAQVFILDVERVVQV